MDEGRQGVIGPGRRGLRDGLIATLRARLRGEARGGPRGLPSSEPSGVPERGPNRVLRGALCVVPRGVLVNVPGCMLRAVPRDVVGGVVRGVLKGVLNWVLSGVRNGVPGDEETGGEAETAGMDSLNAEAELCSGVARGLLEGLSKPLRASDRSIATSCRGASDMDISINVCETRLSCSLSSSSFVRVGLMAVSGSSTVVRDDLSKSLSETNSLLAQGAETTSMPFEVGSGLVTSFVSCTCMGSAGSSCSFSSFTFLS